jgi:transposase
VVSDYDDIRSEEQEEVEDNEGGERLQGSEPHEEVSRSEASTFLAKSGINLDSDLETETEETEDLETPIITSRSRASNDLLEWRRMASIQYYVTGKSIPWIADKLLISQRTVERDISYCKRNAKSTMRKYFTQTLPEEVLKSLARLNAVNNAAWDMAERAKEKGQGKLEVDSLRLAKDTAVAITDITTNNKSLIDEAYEIVDQSEKELTKLESVADNNNTMGHGYAVAPGDNTTNTNPNTGVYDNISNSGKEHDHSTTTTNYTSAIISHSDIDSSGTSTTSNSI